MAMPEPVRTMNEATHNMISPWPRRAGFALRIAAVALLALVAFGFYTGDPVFFLKWFFGLQADD